MFEPEYQPVKDTRQNHHKRLKAWKPKKWRPEYERMVAYSCVGWSNIMIAKELGYTKEHVSTILNMDEAENVRLELLQRMRQTTLKTIPESLEYVAQKTAERLVKMVDDDALFERSPFQVIDRGMEVMKGISYLKSGGNGSAPVTVNLHAVISSRHADDLAAALSKADEVKQLHAGS